MLLDRHYAFREELMKVLVKDLIGPSTEREIIEDFPLERYVMGVLYPQRSGSVEPEQDIDVAEDDDEGTVSDPPVALANVKYPSSMGMSFSVDGRVSPSIEINLKAARYLPLDDIPDKRNGETSTTEVENKTDREDAGLRRAGERQLWQREPLVIEAIELDITKPIAGQRSTVYPGLTLFSRVRTHVDGISSVTLVLLNAKDSAPDLESRNRESFLQPEIEVRCPQVSTGAFVERPSRGFIGNDEDVHSYRLLYRNSREFAVGHGCSVRWDNSTESKYADVIRTTFVPDYELRLADSNPAIQGKALAMKYLAESPKNEVLRELESVCKGYGDWIEARIRETTSLDGDNRNTAEKHLDACRQALQRMRSGLALLERDGKAWEAFRLANVAMLRQRARTEWLRANRNTPAPVETTELAWRPFQLAFIVLCLESIADSKSSDRDLADLLWFPTGGGKTEAYLGLIAFTVFLRRLRHKEGGVTALMRYTLRLLTIQQFERAALLICCCESIRKEDPNRFGNSPISLGLWVGKGATPNSLSDARTALGKLRTNPDADVSDVGNPIQLQKCPWCAVKLDATNYWIGSQEKKLFISCNNKECAYSKGLPIFVVDEDVYNYRPSLIIATVDKFAGLPLRDRAADLFNLKTPNHEAQRPPELIIQDELHLISGPLGTLVGLYESAVDVLCSQNGVKPKIIASTATIRRSGEQVEALFNRSVSQFPPPGLIAGDSYFAVESERDKKGTRMYMGLMAPGTSHTTLLVRTYAALLQALIDLPGDPEVKDPYWTLVGYFNSLRVLGGARMAVQDDVNDRINLLYNSNNSARRREIEDPVELTSRIPSGKIPEYLDRITKNFTGEGSDAVDVILATNMISVGVDVDRLGLMAVMGQPQSTSEYIQSTSRVGRKHPGLVAVLFNSARSRDRSHYESFVSYHSALYRQVEAAGVTPFSARSRDRGLHAVLISLARLLLPELRPNSAASRVVAETDKVDKLKETIVARIREISPEEADNSEKQLTEIINIWKKRVSGSGSLSYQNSNPIDSLMIDAAADSVNSEEGFKTPWSLRDVDRESVLYLVRN